jgi:hypothetical protein
MSATLVGVAPCRVAGRSERRAVRPIFPLMLTLNLRQSCIQHYSNHPYQARTRVAAIFPNCYRTRRGFHLAEGAGYAERS